MKLLSIALLFFSVPAFAQQKDELDSLWSKFKFRYNHPPQNIYNTDDPELKQLLEKYWERTKNDPDDCQCPYIYKPGEKVPDFHPNAKYLNDSTLWEWKEVDFGGGWKQQLYDLKPQYKDTLHRYDGSVIEVPIWIKDPNWIKPEAIPQKKSVIL